MSKLWRKDYDLHYDKFINEINNSKYKDGEYRYSKAESFILNHTMLYSGEGSLLDVGCGGGIWSIVLSKWYDVLGVDNSVKGIEHANKLKKKYLKKGLIKNNCDFKHVDIEQINDEKFDVLFCRAPEFFGCYSVDDAVFKKYLDMLVKMCNKKLVLTLATAEPFKRYVSRYTGESSQKYFDGATSYFHDPGEINNILKRYGDVNTNYITGRLTSELLIK